MTTSIRATSDGLSAELAVNAVPKMRFGADTSGQPFSFRNLLINGGFNINQRAYVSGAAVGVSLYGLDRWKMAASADTFTFSTTANKTTVTIPATKVLQQVVEGLNLQTGTYTLSWEGTAQGKIGAGSLSASGVTGSITGGTDTTIEFGPGTVSNAQLEFGTIATPFEQRPISVELDMCQRYYETGTASIRGYSATTIGNATRVQFRAFKRAVPTIAYTPGSTSNVSVFDARLADAYSLMWYCAVTAVGGFIWDGNWTASAEL